ncbi:enoyl-CoA hydratase/isomerase family protein [Hippea maritima]|uniref:Enoyl-CoA hydratase/isomerase n=1 Tax=Hippea maritima (strain ATCC 700847 / DSM 10411 / MH2) TaxID=760142 RepID=F2LVJ2_HIPMA|nr:enoyl-CoA hydratase/isomerase family protein [Hippea maritima]AEA33776.1 Enoyl-CoA hydratase/isomerase [Hippea maritima DSM 10411]
MSFNSEFILFEKDNDIGILTLNRANKHNAINKEYMNELSNFLDFAEKEPLKALVATSSGKNVFAAGGDIEYFLKLTSKKDAFSMALQMHNILSRFEDLEYPTVCAINGSAIGGGAEIILAFDIRFARSNIFIQFKEKEMGVTTGWGGTYRLVNIVGYSKALKMLLSAEKIDAKQAKDIGLVDDIYEESVLLDKTLEFCYNLKDDDVKLIKYIKRLAKESQFINRDEGMQLERVLFSDSWMFGKREKQMKKFISKRV